ncbi:hypothetical protein V7149_01730 [Bacillus sp. JJ1503]|uniref:hypothetical protein n=1 Tax=Bacillus sp. JJ1503 TaxID=3122956 RepID=UPI002FFFF5AB
MNSSELEDKINELSDKYKIPLNPNNAYKIALVSSKLEHEKAKTIIFTLIGFFLALGIFFTNQFLEFNKTLGIIYISLIVLFFVVGILFKIVPSYLRTIGDLSFLKEMLNYVISKGENTLSGINLDNYHNNKVNINSDNINQVTSVKKVNNIKLHLIYLIIIFLAVCLGLLSLIFVESNTAIGTLSYASTLLSIVLAVIAILITLWDVAGQKNSIQELKEQSKLLKDTVDDFQKSNANAETIVNTIKELQDFLLQEIRKTQQLSFKTLDGLEKIKQSSSEEEKQKIVDELENDIKLKLTQEQMNNTARAISFFNNNIHKEIKEFIYNYFSNRYFTLEEVEQKYYGITRDKLATSYIEVVIQKMLDKIELYVKKENDTLFFKLK